jgi:hypothetical protein
VAALLDGNLMVVLAEKNRPAAAAEKSSAQFGARRHPTQQILTIG